MQTAFQDSPFKTSNKVSIMMIVVDLQNNRRINMKKIKTISIALALSISITTLFTGCSSKSDEKSESNLNNSVSSSTEEEKTSEPVTLSVILTKDWQNSGTEYIFDAYQKKTGNKLDIQVVPGGTAFNDAMNTKAAVNELPDLVFYYATTGQLETFQASTRLVDLSNESFISKISPAVTSGTEWCKIDGKFYTIPFGSMNAAGVIYNKKVFADHGLSIPTTYEAFLEVCETLKSKDIVPVHDALKDGWPSLLFQFCGVVNEISKKGGIEAINTGKFDFTKDEGIRNVVTRHRELMEKGYFNKDIATSTYDQQVSAVAQGQAAMMIQADWAIPVLADKYPDQLADIGAFMLPWDDDSILPVNVGQSVGIAANSKNIEAAKGFLEFFTSDEGLNGYYDALKGIPCYSGVEANLNPGVDDFYSYFDSGKTWPFPEAQVTGGIATNYDSAAAIIGSKSIDKVLEDAQVAYIKSGKDNALAGF